MVFGATGFISSRLLLAEYSARQQKMTNWLPHGLEAWVFDI